MKKTFPFLFLCLIFLTGCKTNPEENADPVYLNEIKQWQQRRAENLKKETGWLNLAGLFWLKEGENRFGSSEVNDIKFPDKAPGYIGSYILKDTVVIFKSAPDVQVKANDTIAKEITVSHDLSENPTIMSLGPFKWFIIKRGERFGIRLRDLESPNIKSFKGIETYSVNEEWKVNAEFIPYNPPKQISVPNILGTIDEEISPGKVRFKKDDKTYELDAVDAGSDLFIIFADETSGEETYGAGRFLYTPKPDSSNKLILDFNRAYNPPCAFTPYATCPLPPKQNYLHLSVTAGEKNYGDH